ncbi:hypothetical protein FVA74_11960 [Salinibacterium sp. dk2585]|uniref:hypothetical protein n=1 Tax=unclassified Salinibacterium TaxID=2632331 RepID=UPI0011C24A27|nr:MULTISPECIES: hypothetical protein [unclassified Salinibacterium]QEE62208.1 hypothetical protein FVA74_11960 [Salinibacterium sp. dk2585]TXK53560.1 hypothetical protein FVP63_10230 [Salinibacterium sp. dk5596]
MRARTVATVALSASIALVATGCTFITPQATTQNYDPSDGVGATIGDVKVLNAVVISDNGENGNLIAGFANNGTKRTRIVIQFEGADGKQDRTVTVAPGEVKSVGSEELFELEGIDAEPGSLFPIFVQHGAETGKQLLVPVLTDALPEYADLAP